MRRSIEVMDGFDGEPKPKKKRKRKPSKKKPPQNKNNVKVTKIEAMSRSRKRLWVASGDCNGKMFTATKRGKSWQVRNDTAWSPGERISIGRAVREFESEGTNMK